MNFLDFIVILLLDILIIVLIAKPALYVDVTLICKTIMPFVTMAFIVLAPLGFFILLVKVCNAFCAALVNDAAVQTANESTILMNLKELGLNCIVYSPMFLLVMCFILRQPSVTKNEVKEEKNIEKTKTALLRLKISLITNNLTILFGVSFLFFEYYFNKGILEIDFIHYILSFTFSGIYLEDTIRITIIMLLGILYYIGIFSISNWYIGQVMNNNEDKKRKLWKYKWLAFCFPVNLWMIRLLQREAKQ